MAFACLRLGNKAAPVQEALAMCQLQLKMLEDLLAAGPEVLLTPAPLAALAEVLG